MVGVAPHICPFCYLLYLETLVLQLEKMVESLMISVHFLNPSGLLLFLSIFTSYIEDCFEVITGTELL
jgi:hypothetical protein